MNEMQFGNKVRQALNEGLAQVDSSTVSRLQAAREQALARQRAQPSPALAWADNVLGRLGGWGGAAWRILFPALALAIGVALVQHWQHNQRMAQLEEIDAQLLTDDLPLDAYLDRGFQNWLKQQRGEE